MSMPTQLNTNKGNTLMIYYQGFIAVAAIFVFFSKLDNYLERNGIGIPLYWMIGFIIISIPIFISILSHLNELSIPVILWCFGYFIVPITSILILPGFPEMQLFENEIRLRLFLLLMLVIFSRHSLVMDWTKKAILLVTIFNVIAYVCEFFNPFLFYLQQHAPGRSSGFYHDANFASYSILTGMIFTMYLFKPRYRIFYSLFILLGVISTFSRSGMVCWVLVVGLFIFFKVIPSYQIPLLFLAISFAMIILSTQIQNLSYLKTADGDDLFTEGTIARVDFLFNPFGQEDDSQSARLGHVDEAWKKFYQSPLVGNGMGSGANPQFISAEGLPQRSHNMYLDQMVEFGFLGAFIYPWLLIASVWKAQGEMKKYTIAFLLMSLIWAFFSHTVMSIFFHLIVYGFVANFTMESRLKNV